MGNRDVERSLEAALEAIAESRGFELVAVFVTGQSSRPTISVLLDREGGIDLEALAEANVWVETAIEETGLVSGAYVLEVSSPGIDRPLRKLADFDRFSGESVVIRGTQTPGERSNWKGVLDGTDGGTVLVRDDQGELHRVEFTDIVGAHIKGRIDFSGKREGSDDA